MFDWIDDPKSIEKTVITSRIRLARNFNKYRFPQAMDLKESIDMTETIVDIIEKSEDKYKFKKIQDLKEREKISLVEDHYISPELSKSKLRGSFLLREDKKVTIMINEEDHMRIQALLPGLKLEEAWEICNGLDDYLEKSIDYAFHEKFGYLTTCPTNVGTGLRASVMLHLPAITLINHIEDVGETLRKIGLTLRGIYGEGSSGLGCLYQISNQTTMGHSEEEIIVKLNRVIKQIISREMGTRDFLLKNKRIELEDGILRSYGLIRNNRQISSNEAMDLLSKVKLGCDLGIIEGIESEDLIKLMVNIQPGKLQCNLNKKMDQVTRNIERSNYIKKFFREGME